MSRISGDYPIPYVGISLQTPVEMRRILSSLSDKPADDSIVFDYFECSPFMGVYIKPKRLTQLLEKEIYDIYTFKVSPERALFISSHFKKLLDPFQILKSYKFYPAKLLFRGEKLDYFILKPYQEVADTTLYEKSKFWIYDFAQQKIVKEFTDTILLSKQQYLDEMDRLEKKQLFIRKSIVLPHYSDVLFEIGGTFAVSERLKVAMQQNGIRGVDFFDTDVAITFLCHG